ncbi:MAG: alpha/beta hydrolase [Acidimicrobiia bacterium]|nr:alpha/beta hydrolase [Acidimicrobiia bacterium]
MRRPLADTADKRSGSPRTVGVLGALGAVGAGIAAGWYLERLLMDRLVPRDGTTTEALLAPPRDATAGHVTSPDGCRIAFASSGAGPVTLLMLHGFAADRRLWARMQDELAGEYRVVAVDLRGHGASDVRRVDRPLAETHAVDVATVLTELDLDNVVLVGHALGGMVALQFLADFPSIRDGRVIGAVLLGTVPATLEIDRAGRHLDTEETARRRRLWEMFTTVLARSIEPGTYRLRARSDAGLLFARSLFGRHGRRGPVAATLEMALHTPPVTVAGTLRAVIDFDVSHLLGSVPTPALILVGERDIVTPLPYSIAMERELPGARLHTILGAGHMMMYEETDLSLRLMREFTRTLVRAP